MYPHVTHVTLRGVGSALTPRTGSGTPSSTPSPHPLPATTSGPQAFASCRVLVWEGSVLPRNKVPPVTRGALVRGFSVERENAREWERAPPNKIKQLGPIGAGSDLRDPCGHEGGTREGSQHRPSGFGVRVTSPRKRHSHSHSHFHFQTRTTLTLTLTLTGAGFHLRDPTCHTRRRIVDSG